MPITPFAQEKASIGDSANNYYQVCNIVVLLDGGLLQLPQVTPTPAPAPTPKFVQRRLAFFTTEIPAYRRTNSAPEQGA
ncbi:MAG: hypothetical protein GY887_07570 [Halieaceae bacterium]|nr:hypothetical protein [Halieaceae bacterium]